MVTKYSKIPKLGEQAQCFGLTPQEYFERLRELFQEYVRSEGCGCCSDYDKHGDVQRRLGELLGFTPYSDGSGYDFYE